MEPDICHDKSEIIPDDTGQNAPTTNRSSTEEELIDHHEVEKILQCYDMIDNRPLTPAPPETGKVSPRIDSLHGELNFTVTNMETSDKTSEESEECGPHIVFELEDGGNKVEESPSVDDEDMDPLLTVDDTESQSSDLINFDTVSYDVIHHQGVDDDDEKSIATMSSLSCDIKLDSPQKHSQDSNSSSLINLLDASLRETSCLDRCPSSQLLVGGTGSTVSSCPSSPSLRSSKTISSAFDDSVSEALCDAILQPCIDDVEECENSCAIVPPISHFEGERLPDNIQYSSILPSGSRSVILDSIESSSALVLSPSVEDKLDIPVNKPVIKSVDIVAYGDSCQLVNQEDSFNVTNIQDNSSNYHIPALHVATGKQSPHDIAIQSEGDFREDDTAKNDCKGNIFEEDCSMEVNVNNEFTDATVCSVSHDTSSDSTSSDNSNTIESQSFSVYAAGSVTLMTSELSTVSIPHELNEKSCSDLLVETSCNSSNTDIQPNQKDLQIADFKNKDGHEPPDRGSVTDYNLSDEYTSVLVTSVISNKENIPVKSDADSSIASLACTSAKTSAVDLLSVEVDAPVSAAEESGSSPLFTSTVPEEYDSSNAISDTVPVSSKETEFIYPIGEEVNGNVPPKSDEQACCEENTCDTLKQIINITELPDENEISDNPQVVRTPSPVDSAVSISDFVTSDESINLKSSGSLNHFTEFSLLEEGSIVSSSSGVSTVRSSSLEEAENILALLKPSIGSNLEQSKKSLSLRFKAEDAKVVTDTSPLLADSEANEIDLRHCKVAEKSSGDNLPQSVPMDCDPNNINEDEHLAKISEKLKDLLLFTEKCCNCAHNCSCERHSPLEQDFKHCTEIKQLEIVEPCFSPSTSDTLSRGLCLNAKQYNVATLDEAQQVASCLVDEILHTASVKAGEKLNFLKNSCEKSEDVGDLACLVVDEVLSAASAQVVNMNSSKMAVVAASSRATEMKNTSANSPAIDQELRENTNDEALPPLSPALVSGNSSNQMKPSQEENVPHKCDAESDSNKPLTEPHNDDSPKICLDFLSDTVSSPFKIGADEDLSIFGNSDGEVDENVIEEESTRTTSSFDDNRDSGTSSKSSLITNSGIGLQSEASLFVDGILELAVKKYEESSSSETSPVKLKGLALDTEWEQEEEELATPCGEMLTEHFMDFESGRNVSVFCSIPESGSDDHLLAYDRIVSTIGNREVDSDTGKSVSVFRSEEEVFYEIQRPSTCTSVFESVEEEDEDMIDTVLPLQDRCQVIPQASPTFQSSEEMTTGVGDDQYKKDCDAFEDAVDAFLSKERLARDEEKMSLASQTESGHSLMLRFGKDKIDSVDIAHKQPEYDLSNQEDKRRMAEKWANGGELEVPDTPEMRQKQKAIREALASEDDVAAKLCKLALTEGGLINDALRREAWPRMLGLDPSLEIDAPSLEDLKSHPEYGQVVLDVNRSLKRFPPDIPTDQRETLQDKLTRLIMYVISKHPHLRYYQGYHDVAVTFLLVVGESIAFQIMERLSTEHLSDCMQPTMERTSYLLHFIYPLLHRLHPTLADYLEKSEVGTMFCLPWFLTWFGHSLDRYQDVVRLYDHFLASPPLAPLYVAAVLVAHRADEVLAVDCDMAAIHALLSHIPESLPLEILLHDATDLYERFPPESIEREVEERFKNEQDLRVHEMEARERIQRQRALRRRHGNNQGSGSWQLAEFQDRIGPAMMVMNRWIPPWVVQQQRLSMRLLFASATFFVGFYVYSRGGDMLPYP